jgi:transposase
MATFTPERRERFLTLLGTGRNVEESCAGAGVGRSTVTRWAARGRERGADADAAEFAGRLDEIREGRGAPSLTVADLVRLLEKAARKGSVQAMKLLLERSDRKPAGLTARSDEQDPFSALPGDELAPRRRNRCPS